MGRTVGNMRKTFTLVLASVLATGAVQVANADTFTVVDDPESYIFIGPISQPWGSDSPTKDLGPLGDDEEIVPVEGNYQENSSNSRFHRLPLEVKLQLGEKSLDHVSVCFYDSIELNTPELINTNCGDGTAANPELPIYPFGAQPFVITGLEDPTAWTATPPALVKTAGTAGSHTYPKLGSGEDRDSTFGLEQTFRDLAGSDDVLSASVSFRLTDAAFNSAGWKVRVVAKYDDAVLELVSERTYTVAYFSSQTSSRPVVNYGDILPGGDKEETEIATVNYRANNTSNITLTAEAFGTLQFGSSGSPAVGEVSLACKPNDADTFDNFFTSGDGLSKVLLAGVVDVKAEGITQATTRITAAAHDCKLFVGDEVATGTYSNTMTIGVGKQPE